MPLREFLYTSLGPQQIHGKTDSPHSETNADGSLNLTKSAPDQLPVFVSDAKKNVCSFHETILRSIR